MKDLVFLRKVIVSLLVAVFVTFFLLLGGFWVKHMYLL